MTSEAKPILHLTMTGYYAGTPYCGISREQSRQSGHTTAHLPYSHVKEFFELNNICPECKKVYDLAGQDVENDRDEFPESENF